MDPFRGRPHFQARPRRQRKLLRDNIMGITRPDIRRLARRGGVVRIKNEIYNEIRHTLRHRLHEILHNVVLVMESSSSDRKVVTTQDVVFALSRMGNTLYGFSHL